MKQLLLLFCILLLGACATAPGAARPDSSTSTEYRVVLPYDTWGEDWPGFDQLIARLDGVQWAHEIDQGIFAVAFAGEEAQLTRELKELAAEKGARFESCAPVKRWSLREPSSTAYVSMGRP